LNAVAVIRMSFADIFSPPLPHRTAEEELLYFTKCKIYHGLRQTLFLFFLQNPAVCGRPARRRVAPAIAPAARLGVACNMGSGRLGVGAGA
jgi:hypothetical protein